MTEGETLPANAGRILVLRAAALGDVVLTLPAVAALRNRYPQARLEVAGYPAVWEAAGGSVDRALSIDSSLFASLYADAPSPPLRSYLQGVDLAVAWTSRDPRPALHGAGVQTVLHRSPYPPPGVHVAEWLRAPVVPSGAEPLDRPGWRLALTPAERDAGRSILHRTGVADPVFLHPGAGAPWKRWPAERFASLASELVAGCDVLLIEGPADADAVAEVRRAARSPLPSVRLESLRLLAAVLAEGRFFVGNDSGVTHLAGVAGVPTVSLFGPTDPSSWAPLGNASIIRHCGRAAARSGEVRVCRDPGCMARITLDDVLGELGRRGLLTCRQRRAGPGST